MSASADGARGNPPEEPDDFDPFMGVDEPRDTIETPAPVCKRGGEDCEGCNVCDLEPS